jgi:phytoene dehydrogenase-like protein
MYDYIIVGSGINALVAAATLGRKGRKVLLLERNERIGGCIRTEEIIAPGYIHDVMATTFVLFLLSPAYAALGKDLAACGLDFAHTDLPTGVLLPDGRHLIFSTDRARNVASFDALASGDGAAFAREMATVAQDAPFLFALLGGSLWSRNIFTTVLKEAWKRGARGLAGWFGQALVSARAHLETTYASDVVRALWAPWVLHCGLGPEAAYSAQMEKVIAFAVEAAGCPIVRGGAAALPRAFAQLINDTGGSIRTGADVSAIIAGPGNRAVGVRVADGETINANQGVICSVTPGQLYDRLLKDWPVPPGPAISEGLRGYRYGKGNMQIHYALSAAPRWRAGAELARVALLHLTPGLDGVSRAANEAERGMLPTEPTICVGQPTALDPSRAPPGGAILWLQLAETPRVIKGDSAGQIATPPDGAWTAEVREAYADRVESLLARHIENFAEIVIGRRVYAPSDLEAMNINLVGGDPYGGYCGVDQFFIWRPFKSSVNHRTYVPGLYHIGASTHPGPGLGGGSGHLLAQSLK